MARLSVFRACLELDDAAFDLPPEDGIEYGPEPPKGRFAEPGVR